MRLRFFVPLDCFYSFYRCRLLIVDLRSLAATVAVIDAGTYAAAARRLHISQPALWAQVRGLEDDLGVRLFSRSGRRVVPTAACLALRPHIDAVLGAATSVRGRASDIRDGREVPARIGCMSSHVSHFLAACIGRFRKGHPQAPLPRVIAVTSATVEETLTSGRIDLAVHAKLPGFEGFALYPVGLVVVGLPTRSRRIDVRRLAGVPIATLPADSGARALVDRAAAAAGVALDVVYEERDATALLALAAHGVCVAVVVSEMVPRSFRGAIATLESKRVSVATELWLHWRDEAALSPSARSFRDAIRLDVARLR